VRIDDGGPSKPVSWGDRSGDIDSRKAPRPDPNSARVRRQMDEDGFGGMSRPSSKPLVDLSGGNRASDAETYQRLEQMRQRPEVVNAPSPNYSSRKGTKIDAIVLHHTGTNNGANDVSAHYCVDRDGTIYQLVPDDQAAWHAGESQLNGEKSPSVNRRSIGIEIVNNGSTPYTEAQYKALKKLVRRLVQKYEIPPGNLVSHAKVALPRGRKTDPGTNFDFARIRRAARRDD